jgi:hypothetical protein
MRYISYTIVIEVLTVIGQMKSFAYGQVVSYGRVIIHGTSRMHS